MLVDVDGVLCPFAVGRFTAFDGSGIGRGVIPRWSPKPEEYQFDGLAGVFWSPRNTGRLMRLSESFALHWGTGWQHTANQVISPLHDLPPFPVMEIGWGGIDELPEPRMHYHWKLSSINEYTGTEPFAFVDDEIGESDLAWAEERSQTVAPTLFVQTDPEIGLTDQHVEDLEAFAASIGEADLAA